MSTTACRLFKGSLPWPHVCALQSSPAITMSFQWWLWGEKCSLLVFIIHRKKNNFVPLKNASCVLIDLLKATKVMAAYKVEAVAWKIPKSVWTLPGRVGCVGPSVTDWPGFVLGPNSANSGCDYTGAWLKMICLVPGTRWLSALSLQNQNYFSTFRSKMTFCWRQTHLKNPLGFCNRRLCRRVCSCGIAVDIWWKPSRQGFHFPLSLHRNKNQQICFSEIYLH